MKLINKIKGVFLIILGAAWIAFVYNFYTFRLEPPSLISKVVLGFILGAIMMINGMRIYRRK
jgi:hypothetical protein